MGYDVHFLFAEMSLRPKSYEAMETYWGNKLHIFNVNILVKIYRLIIDKIRTKLCRGYWKCDDHYPWGIARYVNKLNNSEHFDAVVVQYIRLSRLLPNIDIPFKAIYTHDVFSYKDIRVGSSFYETCNANEEAKAMQRCPNIFAIQQDEATYFKMLSPKSKVYTVYNPYKIHQPTLKNNRAILFLASRMSFNVLGIQWFLDNVWPTLHKQANGMELFIGGTVCERIENQYEDVHPLGRVEDLDGFYAMGDIVINPVYQGTGLKIKTFEALSYGKATIVHPHSMTGIYNMHEAPLISASAPAEWIKAILDLINTPKHVEELSKQSIGYIEKMNRFIRAQYEDFLQK